MAAATTVRVDLGPNHERNMALLKRAQNGDAKAFEELRPLMRSPATSHLWKDIGDLAAIAQDALIQEAFGKDLFSQEAARLERDRLRTALTLPTDGALEKLLIERVLACHLALAYAEAFNAGAKGQTLNQADYWQRHITAAHRRYLAAIRTLATVRKLALPVVQVNIAEKQVNLAS